MAAFDRVNKQTIENFITIYSCLLKHISSNDFAGRDGKMECPAGKTFVAERGICSAVDNLRSELGLGLEGELNRLRNQAFSTWEHYTGSSSYPVPSSISGQSSRSAESAYDHTPHWKGEALQLRKMLIAHSIKFAKAKLKERFGS